MAQASKRLSHNAPGAFYVDSSCIDCDTCRWMAPETFHDVRGTSSVHTQPTDVDSRDRALMALIACPTASIGCEERHDLSELNARFPDPIDGSVYHCGYHSEQSYGAASYFIRSERGNILVDSPRFTRPLVKRLEELGGVKTMFLTHRDDIADHAQYREHFDCQRVLHERDQTYATQNIEIVVRGDDAFALDEEALVIPVPGHTEGSACLLYQNRFLFTGDHLAWSETREHVYAFRGACWYDWRRLIESSERLMEFDFEWILPGHGRRCRFEKEEMKQQLRRGIRWMRSVA